MSIAAGILLACFLLSSGVALASGPESIAATANLSSSTVLLNLSSATPQTGGYFGWSVAIGSGIVVVGAPSQTVSRVTDAGAVYLFNASTGSRIASLTSPNSGAQGGFGTSVAISGTRIAIGAPGETASGVGAAGHVYIYNLKGKLVLTLVSPNAQPSGEFGYSVALEGTTLAVGALFETGSGQQYAGHAYIFDSKSGTLLATLTSPNAQFYGDFGVAVAISGTTVAVGASGEQVSSNTSAGHVYTFDAKSGTLLTTFSTPNPTNSGQFGDSVALNGTTLVVGAPHEAVSGDNGAGHAYRFNAKTGALRSTFTAFKPQAGAEFGVAVAIAGGLIVVGAPSQNDTPYAYAGHAYTFNFTTGKRMSELSSANPVTDGGFGGSVACGDARIVVGAPLETDGGLSEAGRAYVF